MVEPNVHEDRLAGLGGGAGTPKGIGNLGGCLHHDAFGSEARRDLVVGGAREHRADIVMKHFHLLARDLRPGGIVADHGDHRDAVAHEGVELG